jgi:hypothetical protein
VQLVGFQELGVLGVAVLQVQGVNVVDGEAVKVLLVELGVTMLQVLRQCSRGGGRIRPVATWAMQTCT